MKVRVFGTLRHFLGSKDAEVDLEPGDTVSDVLARLASASPELGQRILDEEGNIQSATNVLVNGRNIAYLGGVATGVSEEDRIAIFPAVGGG